MPNFPHCETLAVRNPASSLRKNPLLRKGTVPRGAKPEHPIVCLLRLSKPLPFPAVFADIAMARTRGAKSSSPSTCLRIPRGAPIQDSTSEPPRPRPVPLAVKNASTSPPARCYNTRRSLTIAGASSSGPPKEESKDLRANRSD
ncbi:hypothetical protein CK203_089775 [Vitis vinifera]|uniref:Uncharacterized protein n=1 Tax=Vitis vinifera TaxID=29760 RepID=A0A438BLG0_VITVI|nr:hypothetical protein CK203_089775 [Vitis vinifera]